MANITLVRYQQLNQLLLDRSLDSTQNLGRIPEITKTRLEFIQHLYCINGDAPIFPSERHALFPRRMVVPLCTELIMLQNIEIVKHVNFKRTKLLKYDYKSLRM